MLHSTVICTCSTQVLVDNELTSVHVIKSQQRLCVLLARCWLLVACTIPDQGRQSIVCSTASALHPAPVPLQEGCFRIPQQD